MPDSLGFCMPDPTTASLTCAVLTPCRLSHPLPRRPAPHEGSVSTWHLGANWTTRRCQPAVGTP
eukprot:scaffold8148_cov241-Isochrysis_galbana.AAC.6